MNRKRKINAIFNKRLKKMNAKKHSSSTKPKYVSKAERAKLELEAAQQAEQSVEELSVDTQSEEIVTS
ncbi:MAG: DUF2986 domain-containing protein [Gammaproteobacteria bacterium]|nr:DUF2986 domain-containing protein [Gammaproteobacteria bacterium]